MTHTVEDVHSPNSAGEANRLEIQGTNVVLVQKWSACRIPSCLRGRSVFVLFKPCAGCMKPTHIMERNIL